MHETSVIISRTLRRNVFNLVMVLYDTKENIQGNYIFSNGCFEDGDLKVKGMVFKKIF